ncbi:MAG: baseplate J/gp47 family protein [Eubacterium sp.]|jgi:uncharacterized phage protein gp47/JayE|nr:baseplate J/gp47 family protein [Eubacterium sp.]
MYESMSYDLILSRMLQRVDEWADDYGISIDTREGSLVRTSLSPAAYEMTMMYLELDRVLKESFADTQTGEYLIRRCAERGITPYPATAAIRKGEFNIKLDHLIDPKEGGPIFSLNKLNYRVVGVFDEAETTKQNETEEIKQSEAASNEINKVETLEQSENIAEKSDENNDENSAENRSDMATKIAEIIMSKMAEDEKNKKTENETAKQMTEEDSKQVKEQVFYYKLECLTVGEAGNTESGLLIPVNYIDGLKKAKLTTTLITGRNKESDCSLRNRYFQSLNAQAYGGNIQDYVEKTLALKGVGAVKVYPTFSGKYRPFDLLPPDNADAAEGLSGKTEMIEWVGRVLKMIEEGAVTICAGTVRLVVLNNEFKIPTYTHIKELQNTIDPPHKKGEGMGIAPIGHSVTVEPAIEQKIDIGLRIVFMRGYSFEGGEDLIAVKADIENAIDNYFMELSKEWDKVDWRNNNESTLLVRISQIENRILDVAGVADIGETELIDDGRRKALDNIESLKEHEKEELYKKLKANLLLGVNAIPIRGNLTNGKLY